MIHLPHNAGLIASNIAARTNAAAGGASLLLDTYQNAHAAYSLRKLRAAYAGSAIRVREAGGDTEADIGFDGNGDLDTAALESHCGVNDGFVVTWYDQSGNADNVTQATDAAQPKIVSAGSTLVDANGKPHIEFDGTDDALNGTLGAAFAQPHSHLIVAQSQTASNYRYIWADGNGALDHYNSSLNFTIWAGSAEIHFASWDSNRNMFFSVFDGAGSLVSFNGSTGTGNPGTAAGSTAIYVGNQVSFNFFDGFIQEIVAWDSDQSANRTGIEGNANTYWSVF